MKRDLSRESPVILKEEEREREDEMTITSKGNNQPRSVGSNFPDSRKVDTNSHSIPSRPFPHLSSQAFPQAFPQPSSQQSSPGPVGPMNAPPKYIGAFRGSPNIGRTGPNCCKCTGPTVEVRQAVGEQDGVYRCSDCGTINLGDSSANFPERPFIPRHLLLFPNLGRRTVYANLRN